MHLQRKLTVFQLLTSGVTSLKAIYALNCFKKTDGSPICWTGFRSDMRELAKNKYIEIVDCGDAKQEYGLDAAVLLKRGADLLCVNKNLNPDNFRMTIPKDINMYHEMKLTDIVNIIKTGESQKQYVLDSIADDTQIRKAYKDQNRSLKGQYLPDLDVVIWASRTDGKTVRVEFYVEYDNGNKGHNYWSKKLSNWPGNIIAITRNDKRRSQLAKHIKDLKLNGDICILSLADFKRVGLLNCASILLKQSKSIFDPNTGAWKKID